MYHASFFVSFFIASKYSKLPKELNIYTAMGFGFGCGTLYHISCIITGLFKESFMAVVRRIVKFFSNLRISIKLAFMLYKEDIIENGIVFWPHLLIVLACLFSSIYGFYSLFTLY